MKNILFSLILFFLNAKGTLAWQQLGQTIPSTGSILEASEDGTRIAIGSPETGNGQVSIYDFDETNKSWQLLITIHGEEGEGMGRHISLSPDGLFLAIRRHHVIPSIVQVYQLDDDSTHKIGSDLNSCTDDGEGFSVALTQATIQAHHGAHYWLLVACESHDDDRGMVQLFQLTNNKSTGVSEWEVFLEPLVGDNVGDRFGTSVDLINAPSHSFAAGRVVRVAVSSPHHDEDRGLVQMFSADHEVGWSQIGSNLKGDIPGQQFGTSIAMSATEQPYLLVGSPEWKHTPMSYPRGMVHLYHWRSLAFGQSPSWNVVGHPLEGSVDIGRLGQTVAMSSDGGFIAATSVDSLLQVGYVNLYERDTYSSLTPVGIHPWGGLMAMNGPGSVMVSSYGSSSSIPSSGASSASASFGTRVWLDDREFCKVPLNDSSAPSNVLDVYLERKICRSGVALVNDDHSCTQILVSSSGDPLNCVWVDTPVDEHASNPLPSATPTSSPTYHQSTDAPTGADSATAPSTTSPTMEPSPSTVPTYYYIPTKSPTTQPTSRPSAGVSTRPTENPTTMYPSLAPSIEASVFPSILPTASPSLYGRDDTFAPTLAPQPSNGDESIATTVPSVAPTAVGSISPTMTEERMPEPSMDPTMMPTVGRTTDTPSIVGQPSSPSGKSDELDGHLSDTENAHFTIRACRCDDENECTNQPLPIGSDLKVCVFAEESDLSSSSLLTVDYYELSQDSLSISAINDGHPISSDVSQECVGSMCHIQTSSINSLFYGDDRPSYLIASGTVLSKAKTNRRNLRVSKRNENELSEGKVHLFETIITLEHTVASSSSGIQEDGSSGGGGVDVGGRSKPSWLLWLLIVLLVLVLTYLVSKKVRQRAVGSDDQ